MQQPKSHSIVILGAGYAGLLCAVRLAGRLRREIRQGNVQVTLVNRSADFVERIRLHEVAAGYLPRKRPIAGILRGTGMRFLQGDVASFDPAARTVTVVKDTGTEYLRYTMLVYALGSTIDSETVPGMREYAYTLNPEGERAVPALKTALVTLNQRRGMVTIVGGGATGIEAAAQFAGKFPNLRLQLITMEPLGAFTTPDVAALLRKELNRYDIEILDNTQIVEIGPERAVTAAGETLPHDLVIWSGGFRAPDLARAAGLPVNSQGRAWTDPMLRAVNHSDIFVIGDAGIPREMPGAPYRMSAVVATISGAYIADQLAALIRGKPAQPFHFGFLGQGIATGPGRAVGFGKTLSDIPKRPYFTGRLGWLIRSVAVWYLTQVFAIERRLTGTFIFWVDRRARRATVASSPVTPHQV
jgi:NADH dehydrogenase FAD-containing subunit